MSDDSENTHWAAGVVNWGHLLVASLTLIVALATTLVMLESRLTRLEERQQMNIKRLAEQEMIVTRQQIAQDEQFQRLRSELLAKLESIGADIMILKITFASANKK